MSLTLGEKLRQAREERGLTLGEVAEQTRISSLYLESIENDDYRTLPGGIFNKGFVKSYAKFVGINEQEALGDYTRLMSETQEPHSEDLKVYRPQVLTDDRAGSSMAPTVILAIVILALMTAGILFLVNYMRRPAETANTARTNSNAQVEGTPVEQPSPAAGAVPEMASLKVEFKAVGSDISLTAYTDGKKTSSTVASGSSQTFEPKESLKLGYYRGLANAAQLSINGKSITLPSEPLDGKGKLIEFEINKDDLAQIWNDGAISKAVPPAAPNENTNVAAATPPPAPVRSPTVKPTVAPKATATPAKTASNTPAKPAPTPRPPTAKSTPVSGGH